ncbi:hypothetical protein GGS24DRAFT_126385 [Hypoxylon argillaceum]|nr:hypothetical protein GGS24DRAFT_126385 [Hypoxylon argillaceum]
MTPIRDASQHFAQSRFRILAVQYYDMKLLYKQESLIRAARAAGWISTVFDTFMENRTAGSAIRDSSDGLKFIAQTPYDDMFPFFSLSLSAHHGYGYENAPDWTAILFLGSNAGHALDTDVLSNLLKRETYPDDFPKPLSPDFMILAVALMRYQVNEIASGIATIRREILKMDDELQSPGMYKMRKLRQARTTLFALRRTQEALYQRHLFAVELASTLEKAFEKLRKRGRGELEEPSHKYSRMLREAVEALSFTLATLKHEVTVASPRIEAQQTMLDSQTNIMIANSSYRLAEKARQDSASMKTIAVVTLVFLPGSFVATLFGTSLFNWMPDDGGQIVSGSFYVFWAISAPLTIVILILWVVWFRQTERRYKAQQDRELDEESKLE